MVELDNLYALLNLKLKEVESIHECINDDDRDPIIMFISDCATLRHIERNMTKYPLKSNLVSLVNTTKFKDEILTLIIR